MQYEKKHTKYTEINTTESRHSVTKPNPDPRKNCSSKCAYDYAQFQYTIQHRTVLIILPPDNRHSLDVVCLRRTGYLSGIHWLLCV